MRRIALITLCIALWSVPLLIGEVTLPKIFGSHMVLQREQPMHFWGDGTPGETVTVEFNRSSGTAAVDTLGRWSVYLPAQAAGGPYTLTVRGTNTIALDDILVGDLWFASGQSNMEMPLSGFPGSAVLKDGAKEIREANHPDIRLLVVGRKGSAYPLEDAAAVTPWARCSPDSAKDFSAVAYFFGRSIEEHEKVPVGLIDSTWGGTPAESWTSLGALSADAGLMPVFAARAAMIEREPNAMRADAAALRAKARGLPAPKKDWHPDLVSYEPAALYNAMIAPFTKLPIRGVIWYQGETNSALNRAPLYGKLFPALIQDWRRQWQEGDFPFLFVQLAGFTSTEKEDWPTIREAQRMTLSLRNTGMAVAVDVGAADNVHPPDKQTVGERLALWARSLSYGENVPHSGPLFRQAVPLHNSMQVEFDHADGLNAHGGALRGFEVAGADRIFSEANAMIVSKNTKGETLSVSSPAVASPLYVRYAWRNFPEANLYNKVGLPASPFTSLPTASPR